MSIHAIVMMAIAVVFGSTVFAVAGIIYTVTKADRTRLVRSDVVFYAALAVLSVHVAVWCAMLVAYVAGMRNLQEQIVALLRISLLFKIVGFGVFAKCVYSNKYGGEWAKRMGGQLFLVCGAIIGFWSVFFPPFVLL